jgi:hypothetical protein
MKEESKHQGWNTKQKRCREPTCWLNRCSVLHLVSVPDFEISTATKSASDAGRTKNNAYSTAQPDKENGCVEKTTSSWMCSALNRPGGSAIDARTTQHPGYLISQRKRKRKRVKECFGWLKTIAMLRKVRHRGIFRVGWAFTFAAAAYNLVRLWNLAVQST